MVSRSSPSDRARGTGGTPPGQTPLRGSARARAFGRDTDDKRGYDLTRRSDDLPFEEEVGAGIGLIYGRNPVREALHGRRQIYTVLIASGETGDGLERALGDWCAETGRAVPPVDRISVGELNIRLKTSEHQDMAAVVDSYPYVDPEEILKTRSLLIALDSVQDPHNLGAIIRTAEGAGAGVLIPRHRAAEVTGAVVKASAGATEHASVAMVRNLADFLKEAKQAGFWIYGATAAAEHLYTGQDYRYPTIFVVGSEGAGLGRRVITMCDVMVSLPLLGTMGSLNVGVSAGILLYEAVRQRGPETLAGDR